MDENKSMPNQTSNHGHDCQCYGCKGMSMCRSCAHDGKYVLLRWALGLLILGVVFSIGLKIGEFKASMENGYGMNGGYGQYQQYPGMRHGHMYINQEQMMQPDTGTSSGSGMMQFQNR